MASILDLKLDPIGTESTKEPEETDSTASQVQDKQESESGHSPGSSVIYSDHEIGGQTVDGFPEYSPMKLGSASGFSAEDFFGPSPRNVPYVVQSLNIGEVSAYSINDGKAFSEKVSPLNKELTNAEVIEHGATSVGYDINSDTWMPQASNVKDNYRQNVVTDQGNKPVGTGYLLKNDYLSDSSSEDEELLLGQSSMSITQKLDALLTRSKALSGSVGRGIVRREIEESGIPGARKDDTEDLINVNVNMQSVTETSQQQEQMRLHQQAQQTPHEQKQQPHQQMQQKQQQQQQNQQMEMENQQQQLQQQGKQYQQHQQHHLREHQQQSKLNLSSEKFITNSSTVTRDNDKTKKAPKKPPRRGLDKPTGAGSLNLKLKPQASSKGTPEAKDQNHSVEEQPSAPEPLSPRVEDFLQGSRHAPWPGDEAGEELARAWWHTALVVAGSVEEAITLGGIADTPSLMSSDTDVLQTLYPPCKEDDDSDSLENKHDHLDTEDGASSDHERRRRQEETAAAWAAVDRAVSETTRGRRQTPSVHDVSDEVAARPRRGRGGGGNVQWVDTSHGEQDMNKQLTVSDSLVNATDSQQVRIADNTYAVGAHLGVEKTYPEAVGDENLKMYTHTEKNVHDTFVNTSDLQQVGFVFQDTPVVGGIKRMSGGENFIETTEDGTKMEDYGNSQTYSEADIPILNTVTNIEDMHTHVVDDNIVTAQTFDSNAHAEDSDFDSLMDKHTPTLQQATEIDTHMHQDVNATYMDVVHTHAEDTNILYGDDISGMTTLSETSAVFMNTLKENATETHATSSKSVPNSLLIHNESLKDLEKSSVIQSVDSVSKVVTVPSRQDSVKIILRSESFDASGDVVESTSIEFEEKRDTDISQQAMTKQPQLHDSNGFGNEDLSDINIKLQPNNSDQHVKKKVSSPKKLDTQDKQLTFRLNKDNDITDEVIHGKVDKDSNDQVSNMISVKDNAITITHDVEQSVRVRLDTKISGDIDNSSSSDLSTQQSSNTSLSTQQSSEVGLSTQQSSDAGLSTQQSSDAGLSTQQSSDAGLSTQQGSNAALSTQQSSDGDTTADTSDYENDSAKNSESDTINNTDSDTINNTESDTNDNTDSNNNSCSGSQNNSEVDIESDSEDESDGSKRSDNSDQEEDEFVLDPPSDDTANVPDGHANEEFGSDSESNSDSDSNDSDSDSDSDVNIPLARRLSDIPASPREDEAEFPKKTATAGRKQVTFDIHVDPQDSVDEDKMENLRGDGLGFENDSLAYDNDAFLYDKKRDVDDSLRYIGSAGSAEMEGSRQDVSIDEVTIHVPEEQGIKEKSSQDGRSQESSEPAHSKAKEVATAGYINDAFEPDAHSGEEKKEGEAALRPRSPSEKSMVGDNNNNDSEHDGPWEGKSAISAPVPNNDRGKSPSDSTDNDSSSIISPSSSNADTSPNITPDSRKAPLPPIDRFTVNEDAMEVVELGVDVDMPPAPVSATITPMVQPVYIVPGRMEIAEPAAEVKTKQGGTKCCCSCVIL